MQPIRLLPARAWRTYLGGKMIDRLHGEAVCEDSNFPEEWLMSTVCARNAGREDIVEGLSMTESGKSLKECIEEDTAAMLGSRHAEKYGAQAGVLVKLLDAGERLTVQVHPTREMARRLFDSAYGKTECWHIVDCRTDDGIVPCIYLGFREGVSKKHWQELFDKQDIQGMLDCLHRVEVKQGDTYIIHGGVPHAIGHGCFLVEIQEPTDLTVRVERITPAGLQIADSMCHQGLGFEKMFECFEYDGCSLQTAIKRWRIEPTVVEKTEGAVREELVGYKDTPMFCMQSLTVNGEYTLNSSGAFCGAYVLSGEGTLDGMTAKQGDQFFLPASIGDVTFKAEHEMRVMLYYGPKE
ncbi:MAG: class I mannose-6-phosphate isomerase [Oscillospiraceae bacterium]|nr:class I mannose-6-phosphate isomerase [Oscillospiraceae bacterium]MBQ5749231.1 class I mannose-6-phosphate isomerase [Oscillospiraceae bacterium]